MAAISCAAEPAQHLERVGQPSASQIEGQRLDHGGLARDARGLEAGAGPGPAAAGSR